MEQQFKSVTTARNFGDQLPAIYHKTEFKPGMVILDYGTSASNNGIEYARSLGCHAYPYDPYARPEDENVASLAAVASYGGADIVLCSNVLNVIKEKGVRLFVLEQCKAHMKAGGCCRFTVYEGDKSGVLKERVESCQLNRKTKDYLDEIREAFDDVSVKNNVITAR